MVVDDDWIIFVLFLSLFSIFFVLLICGIYQAIFHHKKNNLKISIILLGAIFCSVYYIYCRYINQQRLAYYCVGKKCISIIHFYKSLSVNSPVYAKIYDGKISFKFQLKMKNYAEFLMEDDISISKKTVENKFIIYGSFPVVHGNLNTIEVKEATGCIDRSSTDYIVSRDLKFRYLY